MILVFNILCISVFQLKLDSWLKYFFFIEYSIKLIFNRIELSKQKPFNLIQKNNTKDIHTCSFSSQGVPHITVEVIISRQEKAAWLAEGDTSDAADDVVVAIHAQLLVRPDVKHSTCGVITSGGKSVAIRKELKKNNCLYDG